MKKTMIIDETIIWNRFMNRMTASAADAPYLGMVKPRGTVDFPSFVTAVKEDGCSESELEINRVLTKQEAILRSYVGQNYKVYFPVGIAGTHLTKSFPTQDAPFDPDVNEAVMLIQTNAETRNALAGVKVKEDKTAAATLKGPKINSVCTDGSRFGVIVCYQPFSVAGSGLLLDPSKAADKLTLTSDRTGAVTDVTSYTCDGEGFRVDAQVNASLTPGKYTLTAYVDMGDAEHPNVLSATSKVTVEAGETPVPTVTDVTLDGTPFDEVESVNASGISIDAENWSRTPDDRFVVTYTDEAGGTKVIDRQLENGGAGSGATGDLRPEMEEKLIPLDSEVEFKLLLHGGVEGSPDQVFTTRLALMR